MLSIICVSDTFGEKNKLWLSMAILELLYLMRVEGLNIVRSETCYKL